MEGNILKAFSSYRLKRFIIRYLNDDGIFNGGMLNFCSNFISKKPDSQW